MHSEEATWFGARLPEAAGTSGVVLNIGSSTHEFRTVQQPYIEEKIFRPLQERGFKILHVDQKAALGVDLVGDLSEADFVGRLTNVKADAVFCNNLLMHLRRQDVPRVVRAIDRMLRTGSLLYLSSSARYPYTPDPHDNCFRPDTRRLAALFPQYELLDADLVQSASTFMDDLRRNKRFAVTVAARALAPFYKPRSWYFLLRYLPNINKPYETACVILRKS